MRRIERLPAEIAAVYRDELDARAAAGAGKRERLAALGAVAGQRNLGADVDPHAVHTAAVLERARVGVVDRRDRQLVERPDGVAARDRIGPHRAELQPDRKSTRLNSSHGSISYAVFCLKKKNATDG